MIELRLSTVCLGVCLCCVCMPIALCLLIDLLVQPNFSILIFVSFSYLLQETSVRSSEREKNVLVEELTSQNARLTAQIEAANQMEAQLTAKLNDMRNQYSLQNNNLQVNKSNLYCDQKLNNAVGK